MNINNEIKICFDPEGYMNQKIEEQGVTCKSTFTESGEKELILDIELLKNDTGNREQTADLQVCFSVNEGIMEIQQLQYCYPAREFVLSSDNCDYNCGYGYRYPLSFVSALYKNKGITLIFDDQKQSSVGVKKQNRHFKFTIQYNNVPIHNGQRKIIIKFHNGDWHQGFNRYKSWYRNKYREIEKVDPLLSNCYHIRRYFFNRQFCEKAIYSGEDYNFSNQYQDDQNEIGGVDVGLLFDYAYTPQNNIRCGNAQPFKNLQGLEELNRQLRQSKEESNLITYAYFDPYLIQDGSDFDKAHREQVPILSQEGEAHHIWTMDQWHPCLSTKQWQDESADYLSKVSEKLEVDGFYLDEIGNGEQFICHDRTHSHEIPLDQNKAEHRYISLLKNKFPEKLFMCEFFPSDSNISLFPAVLSDSKTIVDICRFAFPYKKIFKIIDCDRPIGNNTWDINKIFFNGEGLWLDNDLHSQEWYSIEVKALIKKHYRILKEYSYIFESTEVEPLVAISSDAILANRFTNKKESIFTFINVTNKSQDAYLILDEEYDFAYDVYNDRSCEIVVLKGKPCVKVELNPHRVGCIYVSQ